jgi:hypothetical protein
MKMNRFAPWMIFLLVFPVLEACAAASSLFPPTPTPTRTPTTTPTSTPTRTPTPIPTATLTPTPVPDFVMAALQPADLPPGFVHIPDTSGTSDPRTYVYSYTNLGQFIFGFTTKVPVGDDQRGFDLVISKTDYFSVFLGKVLGAKVTNVKPFPGLNTYGDMSNAYTGLTSDNQGVNRVDAFMERRKLTGELVVSWYPQDSTPLITLKELAAAVDKRLSAAVP